MTEISAIKLTQCQNDLNTMGHTRQQIELNDEIKSAVKNLDYKSLDHEIRKYCDKEGAIFKIMKNFCNVKYIEFIISHRSADNEWEEDGIWHDDGSRLMAFSLSLTHKKPEGGVLEIRKKQSQESYKIITPNFGEMIIFHTGQNGYEHKINAVTKGERLIIAGWCYPSIISSA